jgi:hypothetical protein
MNDTESVSLPPASSEVENAWLQRELSEAQKNIRTLLRQVGKEQARNAELLRAYNLTVANLMEVTRENTMLLRERDMWKARAERGTHTIDFANATLELTPAEVGAIRKAMARLHHPDVGGDAERMKVWNSLLDPFEDL